MTVVSPRPWVGEPTDSCVVFGVLPDQAPAVITTARMGASLVFVWADGAHAEVERHPDGTVITTPLDPDQFDHPDEPTTEHRIHTQLEPVLAEAPVPWTLRYATGAPDQALTEVAEELDAMAIGLGTREPGFGAWAGEKIEGPVAIRLAHHQHRPVILVPRPAPQEERP